jgi:hypothetical protein
LIVVMVVVLSALLFVPAGRLAWVDVWAYLAIFVVVGGAITAISCATTPSWSPNACGLLSSASSAGTTRTCCSTRSCPSSASSSLPAETPSPVGDAHAGGAAAWRQEAVDARPEGYGRPGARLSEADAAQGDEHDPRARLGDAPEVASISTPWTRRGSA